MEANINKRYVLEKWHQMFKKASDYDLWGQPIEACELYKRLAEDMIKELKVTQTTWFQTLEKKSLSKLAASLQLRAKMLQNGNGLQGISLENLIDAEKVVLLPPDLDMCLRGFVLMNEEESSDDIMDVRLEQTLPVELVKPSTLTALGAGLDVFTDTIVMEEPCSSSDPQPLSSCASVGGTLLPPFPFTPGSTVIVSHLQYIDVVKASKLVRPYITVHVHDASGLELCVPQDTPPSIKSFGDKVFFNVDLHIQKSLEDLPKGYSVFFELKHYKAYKKKDSTLCWSLLEDDEVKEGDLVTELYRKPVDLTKKKIKLLTSKACYLHLKLLIKAL